MYYSHSKSTVLRSVGVGIDGSSGRLLRCGLPKDALSALGWPLRLFAAVLAVVLACPAATWAQEPNALPTAPSTAADGDDFRPVDSGPTAGRIVAELAGGLGGSFVGALGGSLVGLVLDASAGNLKNSQNPSFTLIGLASGAVLGGSTGTWMVGNAMNGDGSWLATVAGALPGALLAGFGGVINDNKALGTIGTGLWFGGAIAGYELSAASRARSRAARRPAVAVGISLHLDGGGVLTLSGGW